MAGAAAPDDVTRALDGLAEGGPGAVHLWMPLLYSRLRDLARMQLAGERTDHTLQATALVHEAFLRLLDSAGTWRDESHLVAAASRSMRRVLVDHARGRARIKRGGGAVGRLGAVDPQGATPGGRSLDLEALDEALSELGRQDPDAARVVEMRFFGGMEEREMAAVLGLSERTVRRTWVHAKAWLSRRISGGEAELP